MQKYIVVGQISPDATRFMRAGEVDMYVAEEVREALQKYAYHAPECAYLLDELPCSCGLQDLMRSL